MAVTAGTDAPFAEKRPLRRISIVTVCLNAEAYIAETMLSVLQQTAVLDGRIELEYIIQDGQSTDRTLEIVRSLQTPSVKLVSAPDAGFYDALSSALQACTGEVVAYLNAGDYFHKAAFDVVLDVMESHPVEWLTGLTTVYNDRSQVIGVDPPYRYRRRLIRTGLYGPRLPFIQQESTFWRASLHRLVDFDRLAAQRYAGDAYLWFAFASRCRLSIVQSQLGGFRLHAGQISENRSGYFDEMKRFADTPTWRDRWLAALDRMRWRKASSRARLRVNAGSYFVFDRKAGRWTNDPRIHR